MTTESSVVKSGGPIVVLLEKVKVVFGEDLEAFEMAIETRFVKGIAALLIGKRDGIDASVDEDLKTLVIAMISGVLKDFRVLGLCTVLEEKIETTGAAIEDGIFEGRESKGITEMDVCMASENEDLAKLKVAVAACKMQSGRSGLIDGVNGGEIVDENLSTSHAILVRCDVEGSGLDIVLHVDISTGLDQEFET